MGSRRNTRACRPAIDPLEDRLCLASSVGWDGAGQGSARLTYYIGNTPAYMGAAAEAAIETALSAWSAVARITFTQISTPNLTDSIDFTFGAIDGSNGTLAYGYLPDDVNPARIAGDIRFDSAEQWEVGNSRGSAAFDLVLTAVHEIGHALGLDHSSVAGSIMADSISPTQSYSGLATSDVSSIRALYAATDSSTPTTTTPTTPTPTEEAPTVPTTPVPRFRGFPRFRWRRFGRLSS